MARPQMLYGSFSIGPLQRARDQAKGARKAFDTRARQVNEQLAVDLQRRAVANLRPERPAAGTGTLKRVTASPSNRVANAQGFGVGRLSYLRRSKAKAYWWIIEGESADGVYERHVGREIAGYWGGPSPFGAPAGQRFHPRGRQAAYQLLRAAGYDSRQASRTKGVIRHGIRAQRYYANAWKGFGTARRWQSAYEQLLREAGVPIRFGRGASAG